MSKAASSAPESGQESLIHVRRIHRRDLNRVWEFLKKVFRDVNRETVEYQRPRSKKRFLEVYEEEGVEQLLFEVRQGDTQEIVGYAECAFEITGTDNWMNERYFTKHDMRPLFVEELAVHPEYQGRGVGAFMLEQLEHLARLRGCTHLVLEVAENNIGALRFYRKRSFYRLDAAIFMAKKVAVDSELLPPRALKKPRPPEELAAPTRPKRSSRRAAKARGAEKRTSSPPPSQPQPQPQPQPESSPPEAPAGGTREPPAEAGAPAARANRPEPARNRGGASS